MKAWKIVGIIVILCVLSVPTFFVYTRFGLDQYEISGDTIKFKNSVYVGSDLSSPSDQDNLGKTIGIAINENRKRTITDYIWPVWVLEYKNDKEHNRILIRGLMDIGRVYKKM